jgi:hypothetical protein
MNNEEDILVKETCASHEEETTRASAGLCELLLIEEIFEEKIKKPDALLSFIFSV